MNAEEAIQDRLIELVQESIEERDKSNATLRNRVKQLEAQIAAAQVRERALREGFTACIDTLWRYTRLAARERGESETEQLMSANEAVGHFRAALAAAQQLASDGGKGAA